MFGLVDSGCFGLFEIIFLFEVVFLFDVVFNSDVVNIDDIIIIRLFLYLRTSLYLRSSSYSMPSDYPKRPPVPLKFIKAKLEQHFGTTPSGVKLAEVSLGGIGQIVIIKLSKINCSCNCILKINSEIFIKI